MRVNGGLAKGTERFRLAFSVGSIFYKLSYVLECLLCFNAINTTFNNGSLGSRIDEERSEMR